MAGTIRQASASIPAGQLIYPVSSKGIWVTIHDDLEATASSATILNRPLSNTDSSSRPVKVSDAGGKWLVRAKYAQASAPSSPVVRLYAIFGEPSADGTFADDGTVTFMRLDNKDSGATGITVTVDSTNDLRDSTYRYTDPRGVDADFAPSDALGAAYILALVETAAGSVSGAVTLELMTLN